MKLWPFTRKSAVPMDSPRFYDLLASVFGGGPTKSGASVNRASALQVSVVLCCVRAIAEGVAQVPWQVMRRSRTSNGQLQHTMAEDHALFDLLHRKPNRWQTSFAFRETLIFHILLGPRGTAYAFKSRIGRDNRLAELVLLDPERVQEDVDDSGDFRYTVRGKNGGVRQLGADDVWRIPGPSWTGTEALPFIQMAREAIGLTMAAEESQAKLYANGMQPAGSYSVEGTLGKTGYEDLKAWLLKEFSGAGRSGIPLILDRNAKWLPRGFSAADSQQNETRRHQVEEVCRAFRVLPVMAMQSDKASTYASAEQMFIAHLVHTLMPWYERLEQAADCDVLPDVDRRAGAYTLLEPTGMLRGSLKDTAEYLSKLVERGVITRNEARAFLDRNPLPGLDQPLTPSNLLGDASKTDPATE